ncbi:sugar ABC transporter permease [Devosia epidermidihirudinis]|uniref:Sugar ABC transporter permease n=1 Tax=Devosia epidermidihirudinis TaxID=1293439 RepID=A0A0F5Q3A9_9HYPH|nr:sugar ABC transporter permease [Devosia epidermidihirudinis]
MSSFLSGRANEVGLVVGIVVLYAFLAFMAPNFLTPANQLNILRDAAFVGIIAWGMTLVLISGEIDISVGPHVAFAGVVLAKLAASGVPLPMAVLLVLVLGAFIGTVAGFLRARFEVPSFIVTLSLWLALRGIAQVISNAVPIVIMDFDFQRFGSGALFGIPIPAIIMLVLFVVFTFIATRTVFGRSVYAVGGNAEAARLSGIPVAKVRTIVFAISGVLAALTGILMASRLGSGNSGAATGLEFDIIAAVVVGGTSLFGGRGTMLGTLLGVMFIGALVNGLVLMGVDPFAQGIVRGFVILAAVMINIISIRRVRSR